MIPPRTQQYQFYGILRYKFRLRFWLSDFNTRGRPISKKGWIGVKSVYKFGCLYKFGCVYKSVPRCIGSCVWLSWESLKDSHMCLCTQVSVCMCAPVRVYVWAMCIHMSIYIHAFSQDTQLKLLLRHHVSMTCPHVWHDAFMWICVHASLPETLWFMHQVGITQKVPSTYMYIYTHTLGDTTYLSETLFWSPFLVYCIYIHMVYTYIWLFLRPWSLYIYMAIIVCVWYNYIYGYI